MYRLFCILFFCISFIAQAQIPTNYYQSATGSGYTLKTQLKQIIDNAGTVSYDGLKSAYAKTDIDPEDGKIWDIYSENPTGADPYNFTYGSGFCGSYNSEADCYNREHTVPASYFDDDAPMYSDIFHVLPADGYVNNIRSNHPYGEVGTATYTSQNGSKRGTARSGLGYSGTVFEPIDAFKGDLARIYFYMATRYEDVIAGWQSNNSNADAILNGTRDQVFEDWFLIMLMDWHQNDPVSEKETERNDAVYYETAQNNRNPFVDHPEWVDEIWGEGTCTTPTVSASNLTVSNISETAASLTLTRGNGDGHLVLVKAAAAVDAIPVNGTDYSSTDNISFSAAATLGNNNKIIYAGTQSSINMTGFTASTTYHIAVFDYCMDDFLYKTTAVATASFTTSSTSIPPGSDIVFNELSISSSGTDYEFIELYGDANSALDGYSIVMVKSTGTILRSFDLSGQTIPSDGIWVAASPTGETQFSITADLDFDDNSLENNTMTYFLVTQYSGTNNTDLDTNDDGVLDLEPWDKVIDAIGIKEGTSETVYSNIALQSTNSSTLEGGMYRIYDGCGDWQVYTLTTLAEATPGTANNTQPCGAVWNGSWDVSPSSSLDATIDVDYQLSLNGSFTCKNLTVNENAILTIDGNTLFSVNGNITNHGIIVLESGSTLYYPDGNNLSTGAGSYFVYQTMPHGDGLYSMIGSPMQSIATLTGADLGTFVYRYSDSIAWGGEDGETKWIDATGDRLLPGRGYSSAFKSEIEFEGIPNYGTVTLADAYHFDDPAISEDRQGWNLVSNPYLAPIDPELFFNANPELDGFIAIWDDHNMGGEYLITNTFGTISGPNGAIFNGTIAPMQGFFVRVTEPGNSTDVIFTESMRLASSDLSFIKKQTYPTIKVTIDDDSREQEQLLLGMHPEASWQHDPRFDAIKWEVTGMNAHWMGTFPYAIQGIPLIDEEVHMPFEIHHSSANPITFSIQNLSDWNVSIMDVSSGKIIQENNSIPIQENNEYQLIVSPYSITGLHDETIAFIYQNQLKLYSAMSGTYKLELFELDGKRRFHHDFIHNDFSTFTVPISSPIMICKLTFPNHSVKRWINRQ